MSYQQLTREERYVIAHLKMFKLKTREIEGDRTCLIEEQTLSWTQHDTMTVPTHTPFVLANKSVRNPAYISIVDDAALTRRLGIFENF